VKAAESENVVVTVPYKHIPTHAAVDALSGAPSSWKHEDRPKIKEHHKRRSQMVISRTGSSLSTTSYMNAAAGPSLQAPPLPRNSSYSSYNPTWYDRSGDVYYSRDKGKQRQRGHSYNDSGLGPSIRPSPLASNIHSEGTSSRNSIHQSTAYMGSTDQSQTNDRLTPDVEVSPVVSSGNSTTSISSDNLEIPNHSQPSRLEISSRPSSSRPQPNVYAEQDIFDRLHTSTTRKLGEAPLYDSPPVTIKAPAMNVIAQEQKPKKSRWSLMGKRNSAAVAV